MSDFQTKPELLQFIDELYESNINDPYIMFKISQYITVQLPRNIESLKVSRIESQKRIQEKVSDQDNFIQTFLNTHSYFYSPSTERFFYYDGMVYSPYGEEDILNHIFVEASKERQLTTCKQRIKISTLKRIKENSLLKSIPNSGTIQSVINLIYPLFFSSKTQAKYFLTILGDGMLKKTQGLIYFITPHAKLFLKEINSYAQLYLGTHPAALFKYKYHEHEYSNCRLVRILDTIKIDPLFYSFLNTRVLDILCVATHYSTRFRTADEYLTSYSNDDDLVDYSFYLKDRTPVDLIRNFCDEYIIRKDSAPPCSWKTVQYLLKHFLESKCLPTVFFQNELISYFSENINYNPTTKIVTGIFSKYMPKIERFLQFWDENITILPISTNTEYEIDEILLLFKKWTSVKEGITEHEIFDLITHFYPSVETDNEKYLLNIKCLIWDKDRDLSEKISAIVVTDESMISIYDAYDMYCKSANQMIVSKSFFEKYVFTNLRDFIIDEKFISLEFWKT